MITPASAADGGLTPDTVCLVTGASRGIGKEIARALAARGASVVMVGRDAAGLEAAREDLMASVAGVEGAVVSPRLHAIAADLSMMAEVQRLAEQVQARFTRLDVLIHNAGVIPKRREMTPEGNEVALAVNYLSWFLLTHLLLDLLKQSAPARVVAQIGGRGQGLDLDDLQSERGKYDGFAAYGRARVAVLRWVGVLARRLDGSGVTVNAAYPGLVDTDATRNMEGFMRVVMLLMRPWMKRPAQGADTPVWVATAPELAGVTGKMFGNRKEMPPWGGPGDPVENERLWALSERLSGVSPPD